jgi:hypothetical protein
MVSVEVAELLPGVTEDEENAQAGCGAGPVMAQVS